MSVCARSLQVAEELKQWHGLKNILPRHSLPAVFVIAKYHDVLRQLELETLDGVKKFRAELIKDHKGRRDIRRVKTADGLVFFLKRNWRPYKKDGLKSFFKRGEVWSQSRVEWENSLALQRAGIGVAEPIAFGEECGLFWEQFSFILTATARGEMTLDEFIRTCRDADERKRTFDALAETLRRMHYAGLASPDLFARHIFIERGDEPQFCLIDMARLDRRKKLSARLRARDLAALNITMPLRFVSQDERREFLNRYGSDAMLEQLIDARMKHLLSRRKFADYCAPD